MAEQAQVGAGQPPTEEQIVSSILAKIEASEAQAAAAAKGETPAAAPEPAPDELLVGARAVDGRGVEEGDAEVERAVQRADRFRVVARAVAL